ncbi:MAG: DNA primase [Pseudomonadota bacterium]|nr:MAG: DNA primase [Pseudomonadota bacterium]
MIGHETLDRIRRETDIVALIGESLKLSKRGRSHVGLCPFHKEKTPSFHVNAERGFYHCFGCHESGDAIKFLQKLEGLDFVEAVRRLAERAGIEIVEQATEADRQQRLESRRRSDELYRLLDLAAAFYEQMLREHPLASHALRELERRALRPSSAVDAVADALQAFRVGYAPYGWDPLVRHLTQRGASLGAAERAGLVVAKRAGAGYYDRFRHRLMFAVLDAQGRVVAFSGRALDDPNATELAALGLEPPRPDAEKPAKYINSPESPVYRKREALFGIYQARQAIRSSDRAILVEGNFDVVSLHARGIKNVLAPLGTAFTVEQAQQIRRLTTDVVLLFDGDSAGRRAIRAAREVCQRAGLTARVAPLPDGVDPDELVRQKGSDAIERLVAAAQPLLEYLIDGVLDEGFQREDARGQAARVQEALELLRSEEDPTVRALAERHADRIAARLNIADARTFQALRAAVRRTLTPEGPLRDGSSAALAPSRARSRDRRHEIGLEILGAFLDFPELIEQAGDEVGMLLEGDTAVAYAALRQAHEAGGFLNAEDLLAKLPAPIHAFARARLAAPKHQRSEDAYTELSGNVRQLRALVLSREKMTVVEELERAKRTGNFEEQQALLGELFRKARRHKASASDERGQGGIQES